MTHAPISRRALLAGATGALGAHALRVTKLAQDPTKVPGSAVTPLGERSPFERPRRIPLGNGQGISYTPLQDCCGIVTPADLHFERHHAGVPAIDPQRYKLLIHGMVERPTVFDLEALKRFPSVSRLCFLECSGNGAAGYGRSRPDLSPQLVDGLTSTSEWTGVPLATLFREVGVKPGATWFLAEGQDAAVMARSIPVEQARDDGLIAYGPNSEALRPGQGYVDSEPRGGRARLRASSRRGVATGARARHHLPLQAHPAVAGAEGRHRGVRARELNVRGGMMLGTMLLLGGCGSHDHPQVGAAAPVTFGFGRPATADEIAVWDLDVRPDGAGLPPGRGTASQGSAVYARKCAACHGATGIEGPFDRLVGREPRQGFPFGRLPRLVKTIGNYWPYATTLYDYVNRAMPLNAPGSLKPDEVYGLVAFLLWRNDIIASSAEMNPQTLPRVVMPAHDRFVPDNRRGGPEIR